jgi:hypothetical protein
LAIFKRKKMERKITVNGTSIEALKDGIVLLNDERIKDINDIEDVLNTLILALISAVN